MIMVPYSQNGKQIINRSANYVIYGNTTSHAMNQVEVEVEGYNCLVGSDFVVRHMADHEEESKANTNTTTQYHHNNEPEAEAEAEPEPEPEPEAAGSTSKEEEEGTNNNNNRTNWLQLSIGFHHSHAAEAAAVATTTKQHDRDHHHHHHHHHRASSMAPTSGSGLVELDLLPAAAGRHLNWASSRRSMEPPVVAAAAAAGGRSCCQGGSSFGGSLVLEQTSNMSIASGPTFGHQHQQQQQQQEIMNWAFGPLPQYSMPIMPSPSSFSSFPLLSSSTSILSSSQSCSSLRPHHLPLIGSSYFPPPFHFPSSCSSSSFSSGFDHQFDVAGPSSNVTVRVVDPPPRPHSGIWFMLQASQNQAKEPFLPQIPKNYLRIKDGRMTVRLLLKYLVSKLRLESESEIPSQISFVRKFATEIELAMNFQGCRIHTINIPYSVSQNSMQVTLWVNPPRCALICLPYYNSCFQDEIDITCRGQQLLPFFTLQHVRDNIWTPRDTTRTLLSDSSTTDHVMVLHYGRSTA